MTSVSNTNTNPNNFQIQLPRSLTLGAPELVTVAGGSYAATDHTPLATITGTYLAAQVNGKTTKTFASGPNTGQPISGVTTSELVTNEPLTTLRVVVSIDPAGTFPNTSGELRVRGYNASNTTTEYSGIVTPALVAQGYQQAPKLVADATDVYSTAITVNSGNLIQGRLLTDGTIALTQINLSTGVESAVTSATFNASVLSLGSNDLGILSFTQSLLTGLNSS